MFHSFPFGGTVLSPPAYITRPLCTGRENPLGLNLAQGPIMELNYQISSLTSEIRNLRDVMQALSNTHLFKHNPPGPGTDCGFK